MRGQNISQWKNIKEHQTDGVAEAGSHGFEGDKDGSY